MEKKIIDVSRHQGTIDWKKVKDHIDGAIIRCGYGKNIRKQDDEQFLANINGCITNNIPFGIYLYSYAKDICSAQSEAEHALHLIRPYKDQITYPVYYDLEEQGTEATAVENAKVFCKILTEAGFVCGIYANQSWWKNILKDKLNDYPKWVARYYAAKPTDFQWAVEHPEAKPTGISGGYDMWQFTDQGSIPGIKANVDLNICYKDY